MVFLGSSFSNKINTALITTNHSDHRQLCNISHAHNMVRLTKGSILQAKIMTNDSETQPNVLAKTSLSIVTGADNKISN